MKQMKLLKNLLTPFLQNFQTNLEEPMRGCDFVSDSTDLLYYNLQKVGLKRSGSYIHSSEWLKNKRTTINPQNNADNCFQYALTVALNYQSYANNTQRIPKIKPFIDQYDWKGIDFPTYSKD